MSDSGSSDKPEAQSLTITPDEAEPAAGSGPAGDTPATAPETSQPRGKSGSVIIVTPEEEAAAVAEAGASSAATGTAAAGGDTDSPSKPRRSLFSIFSPKNKKKDKKEKKEKEKKEKKAKKKSKKQIATEIQAQEEAMQAKVEAHQRKVIEARKRALQERLDRERDAGQRVKQLEAELAQVQASHSSERDEADAAQRKLQASLSKAESRGVALAEELASAKLEASTRHTELQAQSKDLETRLEARDAEIERLQKAREELEQEKDRQHEALVAAMGSSDAATSALQKQFSELKEKLSSDTQTWDAERRALQDKNQVLDAELRQVRAQLEDRTAALAAAEQAHQEHTASAEAELAASSAETEAVSASLRSAESQLATSREKAAAEAARGDAADAKASELSAERDELLEILDAREGTLKKLISSRRAAAHQLRVVSGTVARLSRVLKEDEGKRRRRRGARSKSAASRAEVASLRAPGGVIGDFDAFEFLGNEFQELNPDENDCVPRAKAVDLYVHALTLLQRRNIKTPTFANAEVKQAIRKVMAAATDDDESAATMDEEEFLAVFQMGLLGVDPAAVDATLSDARSSDSVEAWLSSAFVVLDWKLSGTIAPAIALRFVREVCAAAGLDLPDHAAQGFQDDSGSPLTFKAFSDAWAAIEAESSEENLVKALRATAGVAAAAAAFARATGSSKSESGSSDAVRSLVQRVVEDELDETVDLATLPHLEADSVSFKDFLALWNHLSLPLRFVLLALEKSETRAKLEAAFGLVAGDPSAVSAATPMVLAFYESLCKKTGREPDEALVVEIRKIGDQVGAQEFQDLIGRAAAAGSKLTGSGSKLLGLCRDLETAVDSFKTKYENPFQIQVSDAPLEVADDVAKKAEGLAAEAVRKQEEAEAAKTRSRELPLREQTMAFLRWTNEHLAVRELEMDDLIEGFKDGTMLIQLLEILTGKKLPPHNAAAKCHLKIRRLENAQIALDFLQQVEGVRLVNISGSDIEAGHAKAILGLMWTLVLKFDAHETNAILAEAAAGAGEADKLRAWVDEQMQFAQLHPWETRSFMIKFTVPTAQPAPAGAAEEAGAAAAAAE